MIHIALAFDENYQNPFLSCAASIFINHPKGSVVFHIIATGIPSDRREEIKDWLAGEGFVANFYDVTDPLVNRLITLSTWTQAVYYRLYFPFLVDPTIERLLYLDTDTIVLKNLNDFYTVNMEDFPVAAVYDNYVKIQPLIGIEKEGEYFNSGVMLMDLNKWRNQKISERVIEYLVQYPHNIRFVDQCGLNHVLRQNWMKLAPGFNLLYSYLPNDASLSDWRKLEAGSTIIHFTLQRPWLMLCKNRFRSLYRLYLNTCTIRQSIIIVDFSVKRVPAWIKLKFNEFYLDNKFLQQLWRKIKSLA